MNTEQQIIRIWYPDDQSDQLIVIFEQYIIVWIATMAEENIWKKQAQMNRLKAEGKTDPPSPSKNVTLDLQ